MANIKNNTVTIELPADGEQLLQIQHALILGIETIGCSIHSGNEDHRNAIYFLSELLRQTLLNASQTNVAIGKKPYVNEKFAAN